MTPNPIPSPLHAAVLCGQLLCAGLLGAAEPVLIPQFDGEPWTVARNPDLGPLHGPKQQPVDFAIWQAADGTWQIWSCIRFTKEEGGTRLFHRWEGKNLTDKDWRPMGVAMRAEPSFGEQKGMMQAPHVVKVLGDYYMFYGIGNNIAMAKSADGKTFARQLKGGRSGLLPDFKDTRDIMVLPVDGLFYGYFTAYPGPVYARTSTDLWNWSDPPEQVAYGGSVGTSGTMAQCPFVYYHKDSGYYYLFRTQGYGHNDPAEVIPPLSTIYRSKDPKQFGIHTDQYMVGTVPVAAPEIFDHQGQTYLAGLAADLQGIYIVRLKWVPKP